MHHPILFSLFLCTLGTVTQWPSKPTMLDALLDAIAEARVTSKEVYMPLGYTQSHWSKIERGEASLPFHRLSDLPPAVKDKLLPKIAYVFWSHRQSVSETRSA